MIYSNRVNKDDFHKLRRSKKWQWLFLASGEWSQSPYHQGNVTLYYAYDSQKGWAALKQIGFPTRIVVIIRIDDFQTVEDVVAELLLELWYAEDYRIEMISNYDYADEVDLDMAESLFLEKRAKNRRI
ncbi:hypothetical protein N9O59_01690 [Schleiferiaceae bacterium]|nr:hypothetical protein [Schleiferiaceae bacterium]